MATSSYSRLQRIALQVKGLVAGADAGVADVLAGHQQPLYFRASHCAAMRCACAIC